MPYRLIAIDLDGTLLADTGRISEANLEAMAAAQEAGMLVVPCTGRAWCESKALAGTPADSIGVFVTGAAVVDIPSGQSLDLAVIEPNLAYDVVRYLYNMPEAVLVLREASLAGHDYLVTGNGRLALNTEWWFKSCGAAVAHQENPTADDLHHTLRIGMVANRRRLNQVIAGLDARFGGRLFTHAFQAVQKPDDDEAVFVLEIFAVGVDKWRGLQWIAGGRGIAPSQIVAIGDEINDVTMIRNAGCGIAMGNAVDQVKNVARHLTRTRGEDGVAHAISRLLSGVW